MLMTVFEPMPSGVGSNRSAHCATTTRNISIGNFLVCQAIHLEPIMGPAVICRCLLALSGVV